MVHFGQYLKSNVVPEWKAVYINYKALKKIIKKIVAENELQGANRSVHDGEQRGLLRASLSMDLTSDTQGYAHSSTGGMVLRVPPAIKLDARAWMFSPVNPRQTTTEVDDSMDHLEPPANTMLLDHLVPDGSDAMVLERSFFSAVQKELEKVTQFFEEKVRYFTTQLNIINDQLKTVGDNADDKQVLQQATQELYRGLDLLCNYRILNYTGFCKIIKKHDKKCSVKGMPLLMPHVLASPAFKSYVPTRIRDKAERMYLRHFLTTNRLKTLQQLRGIKPKASLWTTCILGTFSGVSLMLLLGFVVLVLVTPDIGSQPYFLASFPVFRGLGLVLLHCWLWGLNVYLCRLKRINHGFILKTRHRFPLGYQTIWMACSLVTLVYCSCIVVFYLVCALQQQGFLRGWRSPGFIPLILFLGTLCLLFLPCNVFVRPSRVTLLVTLGRIITTPLTQVQFLDFFMADQVCSLVGVLYDLQYSMCFFVTGAFLAYEYESCSRFSNNAKWVVAFLPYYWRFMQSLRRFADTRQRGHLYNAGKYLSSCCVTLFALLASNDMVEQRAWVVAGFVSTVYSYSWDIIKDWGLLEGGSSNYLLREELLLQRKWVYFVAAATNLVLRVCWVLTISPTVLGVEAHFQGMALGAAEIIRRTQWNFFRLENEHLNNCGQFRAVNVVPLDISVELSAVRLAENDEPKGAASSESDGETPHLEPEVAR